GPDAFQLAFPAYRTPQFWAIEWGTTPTRAHNDLLHMLSTQGLFGLIAMCVFVTGLIRSAYRSWRSGSAADLRWIVAAVAVLVAFAVQGFFGFATIATATLAVTLAAALTVAKSAVPVATLSPNGFRRHAVQFSTWVAAIALIGWIVVAPMAASTACRDGMELL